MKPNAPLSSPIRRATRAKRSRRWSNSPRRSKRRCFTPTVRECPIGTTSQTPIDSLSQEPDATATPMSSSRSMSEAPIIRSPHRFGHLRTDQSDRKRVRPHRHRDAQPASFGARFGSVRTQRVRTSVLTDTAIAIPELLKAVQTRLDGDDASEPEVRNSAASTTTSARPGRPKPPGRRGQSRSRVWRVRSGT